MVEWVVWDAFDTYRMWWLSNRIRTALVQLWETVLKRHLGEDGYEDWQHIWHIISTTEWGRVPRQNQQRPRFDRFPICRGLDGGAGNFVCYDFWTKEIGTSAEARTRRVQRDEPLGYNATQGELR